MADVHSCCAGGTTRFAYSETFCNHDFRLTHPALRPKIFLCRYRAIPDPPLLQARDLLLCGTTFKLVSGRTLFFAWPYFPSIHKSCFNTWELSDQFPSTSARCRRSGNVRHQLLASEAKLRRSDCAFRDDNRLRFLPLHQIAPYCSEACSAEQVWRLQSHPTGFPMAPEHQQERASR